MTNEENKISSLKDTKNETKQKQINTNKMCKQETHQSLHFGLVPGGVYRPSPFHPLIYSSSERPRARTSRTTPSFFQCHSHSVIFCGWGEDYLELRRAKDREMMCVLVTASHPAIMPAGLVVLAPLQTPRGSPFLFLSRCFSSFPPSNFDSFRYKQTKFTLSVYPI